MSWLDDADGVIDAAMVAFGEPVSFDPPIVVKPGTPFGGRGKYDEKHAAVDLGGNADASTTVPVLTVRIADFSVIPQQDNRLTVRQQRYSIYDPQPDGQGGLRLVLKERKGA